MNREYLIEISRTLADQVATYTAPWQQPQRPGIAYMPTNPISGTRYKAANAIRLAAGAVQAGYRDNRWLTARQAERLGASLRPRQAGLVIHFWSFTDEGGRLEKPRVTLAVVYNAEQFNGLADTAAATIEPMDKRSAAIRNLIASSGATVVKDGGIPRYDNRSDIITLRTRDPSDNPAQQHMEAVHQFAHWTGHETRLAFGGHPPGSKKHALEELRVNIASLLVGDELRIGFDPGRHQHYAGPWREALIEDPAALFRAAMTAEQIAMDLGTLSRAPRQVELDQEQMQTLAGRLPIVISQDHPAMKTQPDRIYLAVPYSERDEAKERGARWDKDAKAWFVPAGGGLEEFDKWRPGTGSMIIEGAGNPQEEFAAVLAARGLIVETPVMDGTLQRVQVDGDRGAERSGAYVGHLDAIPAGYVENFKDGIGKQKWRLAGVLVKELTRSQRDALKARATALRAQRAAEIKVAHEKAAMEVAGVWAAAQPFARIDTGPEGVESHSYLIAKRVPPYGLRVGAKGQMMPVQWQGKDRLVSIEGSLLIPMSDPTTGKLLSLQVINDDGRKQFWRDGEAGGTCLLIGKPDSPWPVHVVEGYATGATIHQATGHSVAVAFNAYNLQAVAEKIRAARPDHPIYIAGDNDHEKAATIDNKTGRPKNNVGREHAIRAAEAVNGQVLLPSFGSEDVGSSDWNDLANTKGLAVVQQQVTTAMVVGRVHVIAAHISKERSTQPRHQFSKTKAPSRTEDRQLSQSR